MTLYDFYIYMKTIEIVSNTWQFWILNEVFNSLLILTMGMIIAALIWKIATSWATASDTISRIKFWAVFLLIVWVLFWIQGKTWGLQAWFFKTVSNPANALIKEIDPNYISSGGVFYWGQNEFWWNGVDVEWNFK